MNTISIRGKEITVNMAKIQFEHEIYKTLDMEVAVVVLTMPKDDYAISDNLYGVIDGKIAWRVEDVKNYNPLYSHSTYTGMRAYHEGDPSVIIATDFNGFRFLINPTNGKIIGTESWVK